MSLHSQAAKYFATSGERPEPVTITNITGKVPAWFKGTVVRNVQGLYESGELAPSLIVDRAHDPWKQCKIRHLTSWTLQMLSFFS